MVKCKECEKRKKEKKEWINALMQVGGILNVFLGFIFSFVGFSTIMYGICDTSALLVICGLITIMFGISYVLETTYNYYNPLIKK